MPDAIEVKLCECGCGRPAPIAKHTNTSRGHIKGKPIRFVNGHQGVASKTKTVEYRFWAKVDKSGGPDSCWRWMRYKDKRGYGRINVNGRITPAHRLSWELNHGPVPNGMFVCHRCDNPSCVNPTHLWIGTNAQNIGDMAEKGRHGGWAKPGELHGNARLTRDTITEIRGRYAGGCRQVDLSLDYGITPGYVSMIVNRKAWKHVQDGKE